MKKILDFLVPDGSRHLLNAPALIALATLALFVHALWVDVVIHPVFFTPYCIFLLLVPGGALSAFALLRIARGKARRAIGPGEIIALLLVPPLLGAVVAWPVLAKTPAWLAAVAFGAPHVEVREFEVRTPGGRGGCAHRAQVVDGLRLYPGYLCVTDSFARRYDRQRVLLRLTGDRTPLGFRITQREHEAAP
jgi:hypothetical protein